MSTFINRFIFRKNFIFFLIKLFKFDLILETAFKVAAPFRSVVEDAALADVFGTLDVFVAEILTFFYKALPRNWIQVVQF